MFNKMVARPRFLVCILIFFSFSIYFCRIVVGNNFNADIVGSSIHWGSLTEELLIKEPVKAIWNMHSQPPLLNSIYALSYLFFPNHLLVIQSLWLCLATLIPILLFKSLQLMRLPNNAAFCFASLYCFYPNTLGYAFSGYNTILVQFGFAYLVYSLLKLLESRFRIIAPFCISLVMMFLMRAPFLGIAIIFILLIVYSLNFKLYGLSVTTLMLTVLSVTVVFTFQFHYIKDFNQLTSSSLGGFSTLRLLKVGMDTQQYDLSAANNCEIMLLKEADSGDTIQKFPPCQEMAKLLKVNLDEIAESGNSINSIGSLQAAILVRQLALDVLRENPTSLFKGVFGSNNRLGSLDYFLSVKTLGDRPLRQIIDNLPFFASLLSLIYFFLRKSKDFFFKYDTDRGINSDSSVAIVMVGLLFSYTVFYSLASEVLENDRYKHEAYPLYFFLFSLIMGQALMNRAKRHHA